MLPTPPVSPPPAPAVRVGKAGIWVGVGLMAVGILLGVGLVVAGARSVVTGVDDLDRVPVEGGGTIEVDRTGSLKVYAERDVAASSPTTFSSSTSGGPVPDLEVVISGPDGQPVELRRVSGSEEYQSDGHWGTRVGRFDADQTGTYTVAVTDGEGTGYDTIAVGNSVEASGLWLIVGGVLGGGFLVFVGAVVLIVSAVRRSRAIKRARPGPGPFPPAGSGPPQPGWPAPPA